MHNTSLNELVVSLASIIPNSGHCSIQASDEYVVINCQWIMYIFGKASEGGGVKWSAFNPSTLTNLRKATNCFCVKY